MRARRSELLKSVDVFIMGTDIRRERVHVLCTFNVRGFIHDLVVCGDEYA